MKKIKTFINNIIYLTNHDIRPAHKNCTGVKFPLSSEEIEAEKQQPEIQFRINGNDLIACITNNNRQQKIQL